MLVLSYYVYLSNVEVTISNELKRFLLKDLE